MVRTQIQLTEHQYALLKRLAREENLSMAELIRRAVDYFEDRRESRSKEGLRERARKAAGRVRSGISDLSARHEDHFADSILP